MKQGKVYLIGAGPGDPELLTLKGKKYLGKADVIVGDYLADQRLLRYASKEARYIYVGKKAGHHTMKQEEINQLLVEEASKGLTVARLKGGDPFVFGRGGEEIEELVKHHIPFEEIPGITSAIAAPAYAGIPITHRKISASFAVITGHEDPTKEQSSIHWEHLAAAVDTLVFLMGVGHAPDICRNLMKYGRSPDTPAAFVRWGTRPYQETFETTVGTAAEDIQKYHITPPAIFIVGDVVKLRKDMRWFDTKPLFGKRIVITRTRQQASSLTEALEELGAECFEVSTIKIVEPSDHYQSLDKGISHLPSFQWLIFTSVNGVHAFFKRLFASGRDVRALGRLKIGCIGKITAKSLESYGIHPDVVPDKYKAEDFYESLKGQVRKTDHIFICRARQARPYLADKLEEQGCAVYQAEAYDTVAAEENKEKLKEMLLKKEADMITFTSSSTVKNLVRLLDGDISLLKGVQLACIGPVTADTCKELNLAPDIVSDVYTIKGLVHSIVKGADKK